MEIDSVILKLIDRMQNAFAYHKIILDENNKPVDYEYIYVNTAFEELTGLKRQNILGKTVKQIIPDIQNSSFNWIEYYGNIALNGVEDHIVQYFDLWDRWYRIDVFSPEKNYFVTFFSDITDIKKAEEKIKEQNEIISQITENLDEITFLQDVKTREVIYLSSSFERIYGIPIKEIYKNPRLWIDYVYPKDRESVEKRSTMENTINEIKEKGYFTQEYRIVVDDNIKWIRTKILPVINRDGQIYRIVGIEQDITEQKNMEIKLRKAVRRAESLAMHDYLTGLYNRRAFFVRTKEEINRAKRRGETFSIILTDLDRFKLVNDTYGHDAGDKILKVFSSILRKYTRRYDIVARFGGEEFIIFLSATNKENAKKKAEQLREYVERSEVYIRDVDKKVKFTASFGVSELLPEDNYDVEKVIKRADKALYLAKNSGRNMVITD